MVNSQKGARVSLFWFSARLNWFQMLNDGQIKNVFISFLSFGRNALFQSLMLVSYGLTVVGLV
jgi:hypothetical protein